MGAVNAWRRGGSATNVSMRSVDYGGSLSGPTIIVEMVTEGSRLMADPVPIVYKPELT